MSYQSEQTNSTEKQRSVLIAVSASAPAQQTAGQDALDAALEMTFPASDPVSIHLA